MSAQKYIYAALGIALLVATAVRFTEYRVRQDFLVFSQIDCDPQQESCFVADCSPEDPECDQTPYKKISIPAAIAPNCLLEHTCNTFNCAEHADCEETLCSEAVLDEGEICKSII